MEIWRFKYNGELDTSFGTNGRREYRNAAGGNDDDVGFSIAIDAVNRIYVAGFSRNNGYIKPGGARAPGAMTWSSGVVTVKVFLIVLLGPAG